MNELRALKNPLTFTLMNEERSQQVKRGAHVAFGTLFAFILLHQSDRLLIGPLTQNIIDSFKISYTQMGMVDTVALVVGALCYPLWGWLLDRFARPRLLALASLIWGATTWLNAIAPTYPAFLFTRATTGVAASSYPGIYSLISDYYPPKKRGKIYGWIQIAQPFGYIVALVIAAFVGASFGWRSAFFLTGSLGLVMSLFIFFGVKDVPRGASEPELAEVKDLGKFKFSWKTVRSLFKKKSLVLLLVQGFFGVFPWNVITYFFFTYLAKERRYSDAETNLTMGIVILVLSAGYPIGGMLGDWLFKKTLKGRVLVGALGVGLGALLLWITLRVPIENHLLFGVFLCAAAVFIPFASPNVLSSFYDITEPEIRATTNAIQSFIENVGSALAPLLAGIIADRTSLGDSILLICTAAWGVCFVVYMIVAKFIPKDIADLRASFAERARTEGAGL
jgi:MFS transporter, Spinster family, sphingosine-1-phosphate transporter